MKKALQMKGVPKDQIDNLLEKLDKNPELLNSFKKLEENKEVKALFEKIQKEIEEKKKTMPEPYAVMQIMTKYKTEVAKYKEELMPLMQFLQK